ncbi:KIAA2013 (predicted) [Pycnogonum litorale]
MVLSLGSLSFSDNHLEFNLQPKDLHRDYLLRRINYGVGTHVNISVVVGEDNKAVLYASLDQNDKEYYTCDGGCLDAPVQLSKAMSKFPVKKTEPPTPVLYITSDREHMEQLKHTIHVTEVVEGTNDYFREKC